MVKGKESFWGDDQDRVQLILGRYPIDRRQSALLPLLHLAQDKNDGWLSPAILEIVAQTLSLSAIVVWEVASFYTMFRLTPKTHRSVRLCHSISCQLRCSDQLIETALSWVKHNNHHDEIEVKRVECLGRCSLAPIIEIDDQVYNNVDDHELIQLLQTMMLYTHHE